jgi:CubicO group peptidase (beta-lactamase class C family)
VPGAALAVIAGGQEHTVAAGQAADGVAIDIDHQFPLMSLTKLATAMVALTLERSGHLSLDAPVDSVLDLFKTADGLSSQITLRHLLANTSGLPLTHFLGLGEDDEALLRMSGTFGETQLSFSPGLRFSYSNPGYALAGAACQAAAGEAWEHLIEGLVLEPAGTAAAGFGWPPAHPITQHWMAADMPAQPVDWFRLRSEAPAGAGTLYGTAADTARLGMLAARQFPEMRTAEVPFPGPHVESWGLGCAIYGWGAGVFGWDGVGPGVRTFLRVLPDHNLAVALMTNGSLGRRVLRKLLPALLVDLAGVEPPPEAFPSEVRPAPIEAAGSYRSGNASCSIAASSTGLALTDWMGQTCPLTPALEGSYLIDDPDVDVPHVELDNDYLTYSCSAWRREPRLISPFAVP